MDGSGGEVSRYMVGLMHMWVVDFKNGKFQYITKILVIMFNL